MDIFRGFDLDQQFSKSSSGFDDDELSSLGEIVEMVKV